MKKKLYVIAVIAFYATMAMAQNEKGKFSIRPMAGINLTTLGNATIEDVYKTMVRFTAGAEAEYGVNKWLGLSMGLIYSQQGAKLDGSFSAVQTDDKGDRYFIGTKFDGKLHTEYLNVPLMANIYLPVIQGLALKAGVQVGILVNDRLKADELAVIYKEREMTEPSGQSDSYQWLPYYSAEDSYPKSFVIKVNQTDVFKTVDVGIPVGLSYEYKGVTLDARYYFGLTKPDKTENPDNARNRYLSITLGYRFHL